MDLFGSNKSLKFLQFEQRIQNLDILTALETNTNEIVTVFANFSMTQCESSKFDQFERLFTSRSEFVPFLHYQGEEDNIQYLVVDKLSQNLEQLLCKFGEFSNETIYLLFKMLSKILLSFEKLNQKLVNFQLADFFLGEAENDGKLYFVNGSKVIANYYKGTHNSFFNLIKILSKMKVSQKFKQSLSEYQ